MQLKTPLSKKTP